MPLIDPNESDNDSNASENSGDSKRRDGDGEQGRVAAKPPEGHPDDFGNRVVKSTKPIVDNGARPEPPRAVFPAELKEIAESQPQRARQLLRHMEENGEISELGRRGNQNGNPLADEPVGGSNTRLQSRVREMEKRIERLSSAVSALVELHDEIPVSATCDDCGGDMEFKQPFTGNNRLECEDCGRVEVGPPKEGEQ